MDLSAEVERLRLDLLAVQVSTCLTAASVDHVVLKGPSTSLWLYDVPRRYKDVDVLVPSDTVDAAVEALAGVAEKLAGGVGEEAEHGLLLHSTDGFEIDLHVSLPTLPPGDSLWPVLAGHVDRLELDVGTLPVLDLPARCFVLCLHALNSGPQSTALEDLRRALTRATPQVWAEAWTIAGLLDAEDLMAAGRMLVGAAPPGGLSRRARLRLDGAPASALGFERLSRTPRRELPRAIAREVVPTRGFMRHANPDLAGRRSGWLPQAHFRRWAALVRDLPAAWRAWRASSDDR